MALDIANMGVYQEINENVAIWSRNDILLNLNESEKALMAFSPLYSFSLIKPKLMARIEFGLLRYMCNV